MKIHRKSSLVIMLLLLLLIVLVHLLEGRWPNHWLLGLLLPNSSSDESLIRRRPDLRQAWCTSWHHFYALSRHKWCPLLVHTHLLRCTWIKLVSSTATTLSHTWNVIRLLHKLLLGNSLAISGWWLSKLLLRHKLLVSLRRRVSGWNALIISTRLLLLPVSLSNHICTETCRVAIT